MIKPIRTIIAGIILTLALTGCSAQEKAEEGKVLKVGATPVPHAELLEQVKPILKEQGIDLEIVEFTDYVKPNLALSDGEIDANFFQHVPYLDSFNQDHDLDLISVGTVHVEPLGLFSESIQSIDELKDGSLVAIPSDSVNGGRALILLEANGLIKLKKDAGLEATEKDIAENPHNYEFKAIEAAQLPRVLPDVDAAIITGNYAIEAGINPATDSLLIEGADSPYANIIAVKSDYDKKEEIEALLDALQSEDIKTFINEKYAGGVVEAFGR